MFIVSVLFNEGESIEAFGGTGPILCKNLIKRN